MSGGPRTLGSFAQSELGRSEVVGVQEWTEIRQPTALGGLGLAVSHDDKSLLFTHTKDIQSDLVLVVLASGH